MSRSDIHDNAQQFEALFEEFLAKARPLLTNSARCEHFDATDANNCLDEIEGFAMTIRDLMVSADCREAESFVATGRPNDPSSRVYRVAAE